MNLTKFWFMSLKVHIDVQRLIESKLFLSHLLVFVWFLSWIIL
jgi:hypothetical protein